MKSLAVAHTRAALGVSSPKVCVEVHLSNGLPKFTMVGLAAGAVKESKDRVRSAILNSYFDFPSRCITVSLAPADLPKEGGRYDLPIALGILAASGQIPPESLDRYEFAGELALSGELRPIHGALPLALAMQESQRELIISSANAAEAALASQVTVYGMHHLQDICSHLRGELPISQQAQTKNNNFSSKYPDIADVKGQFQAKRALEIAAAGGHSILMTGPPGSGKSMLAARLPGIMPNLSEQEALQAAAIQSLSHTGFTINHWGKRAFRSPHHTASSAAMVGGGRPPGPGEISLAHRGILFLDELPEFSRSVLEALREPLETGTVCITRVGHSVEYPADFQLITAMNPCPCGYAFDGSDRCCCSEQKIANYQQKLSGPLLDRIDLHVLVPAIKQIDLLGEQKTLPTESSESVKKRVISAREKQMQRQKKLNHLLSGDELKKNCLLDKKTLVWLQNALEKLSLSGRGVHRLLRVARTIADLDQSHTVLSKHLSEGISFSRGNYKLNS